MIYRRAFKLAALCSAMLVAAPALAQVSTVNPAKIIDRFGPASTGTPTRTLILEREGDEVRPSKGSDQKVFVLSRVVLKNSTIYGETGMQGVYAKYIGQKVSFADLQTLAQEMTAKYRADGYILSRVVLEPQSISGGEVHFRAIEGYVDQIEIKGEIKGDRELLDAYAANIKNERPLTSRTLERYLLLMDDLPGVTARSLLKASPAQQGASALTIDIADKETEGSLQADNRGNKFIGDYQLQAVGAINSAFGMYDRNTLRLLSTSDFDELIFGDYSNELQLGEEGTRFITRVALARTRPGSTLEPLALEGHTEVLDLTALHPFIRSRDRNLFGHLDFRAQNSDNASAGTELFDDQVRHVAAGLDYDNIDDWSGINKLSASVTQGLDILGATDDGANRSRINGEHVFTRVNAGATRVQDITDSVSLRGSLVGQYAFDPLLTGEQFAVGGEDIGRAYDSAELLGDHGWGGIVELRYRGIPEDQSFVNSYEPYVFYDVGAVWLKEPLVGERAKTSLTSAGIGTRFNVLDYYSGYVELSTPLTRQVASEGDTGTRFFFNISRRF